MADRPKSSRERLTECVLAYADAEDDDAYARAWDNLRKAIAAHHPAAIGELTRAAMAELKSRGIHVGRPRKVEGDVAASMVAAAGSVPKAAARLHVSARTLFRALRERKRVHAERVPF